MTDKLNIEQSVLDNLNAIIYQRASKGIEALSLAKVIAFVENTCGMVIDEDCLTNLLEDNPHFDSIEGDKIILSQKSLKKEEDVNDDIHDIAVDQAGQDMSESVSDVILGIKPGMVYKSSDIKMLDEDAHYFLHQGAIKSKKNYIVCELIPHKELNESIVKCKIDGTSYIVDIPLKRFVK